MRPGGGLMGCQVTQLLQMFLENGQLLRSKGFQVRVLPPLSLEGKPGRVRLVMHDLIAQVLPEPALPDYPEAIPRGRAT
jgi:hypothetical protein